MTETLPARSLTAERAVIGSILNNPATLNTARLALTGNEFQDQRLAQLYAICCDLADTQTRPDPQAVVTELGRRGQLAKYQNGIYVTNLWAECVAAANIGYHITELNNCARVRSVQQAHQRLGQALDQYAANCDTDNLLDNAARQSVALTIAADEPDQQSPVPGIQTWEQFTQPAPETDRWITPGLIRRHDTIMILGASGAGKSVLSRQVAISLAAGIHPFTLKPVTPIRTLLVDLENAPDQTAEETQPLLNNIRRLGDTAGRGLIWPHPEGLNLRDRRDAQLLERVINQTQPDILCMGSLYNAYRRGRDDWDTAAEDVQAVLKQLRTRYNLGLWLEHHMPRKEGTGHTGTPYGGTMWERWPTHGRVIRRHPDVAPAMGLYLLEESFRGDRGRRDLPIALRRGTRIPWQAIYDEGELGRIVAEFKT